MDKNQLKYKLFKSFRIPLSSGDRVTGKLNVNNGEVINLVVNIEEINYDFLTFSTSENIQQELLDLELQRPGKFFGKEKVTIQASVILKKKNQNNSNHKHQYNLAINNNENYKEWVQEFVSQFSKKRLHSYLLASATRMKNFDFQDMSETICLLVDSYNSIASDKDDLKISDYLHTCKEIMGCKTVRIWLYDISDNTLSCQYSTNNSDSDLKIDYRDGIPGKVFNNRELVNLYKAPVLINPSQENESTLAAPLTNRFHKVIGVLEFEDKEKKRRFSLNDEFLIRTLSICFSTHFQMFNPVNAGSKIKLFNPGLKNNFMNLMEVKKDATTLHMIQKLRTNKENILINNTSPEVLEVVVEEMVQSSSYHNWKVVHLRPGSDVNEIKKLDKTVLILERVNEFTKDQQEYLVDYLDKDKVWVISTCLLKDVNKENFTVNFWNKFAHHHLNLQLNASEKSTEETVLNFVNTAQNASTFDEKIDNLTNSLGISLEKEKLAA